MVKITIGSAEYDSYISVAGADEYLAADIARAGAWATRNDDTKARAQMPASHGHRGDHFLPELIGELRQLILAQSADVRRVVNRVEQRGFGAVGHWATALRVCL